MSLTVNESLRLIAGFVVLLSLGLQRVLTVLRFGMLRCLTSFLLGLRGRPAYSGPVASVVYVFADNWFVALVTFGGHGSNWRL